MSATKYDRPRGIAFGVSRTLEQVALPWLKNGKRSLSRSDAELVCIVCQVPETLVNPSFQEKGYQCAERFAELLRAKPADTGQLIRLVAVWRERQLKTKRGRIRKAIELAMIRNREETLLEGNWIFRGIGSGRGLPSSGIPRIDRLENKPWGIREFAIVDPDGNLLRIGQPSHE